MKRLGSLWSVAAALMLGIGMLFASSAARAQAVPNSELSRDWSVRAGIFIWNSNTARNTYGAVGFSGGVERTVFRSPGYDVTVGIGYNGWDRSYSVPVMIDMIAHKDNLRYGGGLGYSFNKRLDGTGSNGTAICLIVGYQFSRSRTPLSLDARYYFIGGSSDELDGLSITLGGSF